MPRASTSSGAGVPERRKMPLGMKHQTMHPVPLMAPSLGEGAESGLQALDCMLSVEETNLWESLSRKIQTQHLATREDASLTRPLLESDIVAAITHLDASTAAIEKQSERLRFQQAFLHKLRDQSRQETRETLNYGNAVGRKDGLELQNIRLISEEISQSLSLQYDLKLEETSRALKTVPAAVAEALNHDDRRLQELQQVIGESLSLPNKEIPSEADLLKLTKLLAEFTSDEARCRLDRIYLEALRGPSDQQATTEDLVKQQRSLEADLEYLYSEIEDVVAMSVRQEFDPLLRSLRRDEAHRKNNAEMALQSTLSEVSRLTLSLENFAAHLESLLNYHAALKWIQGELELVNADGQRKLKFNPQQSDRTNEPGKPAFEKLLHHIGVSSDARADEAQVKTILASKQSRLTQILSEMRLSWQDLFWRPLALNDASSQLILNAICPEEQEQVAGVDLSSLDRRIGTVRQHVENVDTRKIEEQSEAQIQFVEKWK